MNVCRMMFCVFFSCCVSVAVFAQAEQQQENYEQPVSTNHAPADYAYKCVFNETSTQYFILPNDEVTDATGAKVGHKVEPPMGRETEFAFMVMLPHVTYAVDHDYHIWQKKYPFKVIVGKAQKN